MTNVEKFLDGADTKNITKQEGNFSSLIFLSLMPECYPPYTSRYYPPEFSIGKFIFIVKPKYGILFFDLEKYTETSRLSFDRFLSSTSKEYFRELTDFNDVSKEIMDLYAATDILSLDILSEEDLVSKIQQSYKLFWSLLSSSIFSEAVFEDLVKELYKKIGGEESKFAEFFSFASLPAFESFALRFDRELIKYIEKRNVQEALWMFTDYYDAPTPEKFKDKVEKLISEKGDVSAVEQEILRIEAEVKASKEKQAPYYKNLSEELKKLFNYMQISMELRDIRKNPLQRIIVLISYLVKALLIKKSIPLTLATSALYKDFFDGFYASSDYVAELEKRTSCVVLGVDGGLEYEFSDPDMAIKQVYLAIGDPKENRPSEIQGNSACKGLVQGVVKIILNEHDFHKFTKDDILVTSMTRPEFVPLMKTAKGVITDEGGITCHAAIISRELNIPCVIGTKMATRILQDGDMVEVDANKGLIRII